VSFGGLLGIAQLDQILGKKYEFCRGCSRKYATEYEVDHAVEHNEDHAAKSPCSIGASW